jgi:LysR family transcriptional regulator, glycine cleavage system transcriptional activator
MSERVLPLRGIAVFETAARSSSFQSAADELNLTPSAVSHQIRLLEDSLGVRLFDRVGRGVTLTPDGAEYARSVRQSMRQLRAATIDVKSRGRKSATLEVVRLEMPPSFAHCWLMPRLSQLIDALPGVEILINAQGSHLQGERIPFPQLADAPADLQIVYGDKDIWEDRASLLLWEVFQPYCTPAFQDRFEIDSPEKLVGKVLIRTARNAVSWDEWLNAQGVDFNENLLRSIQMDPSHLAIRAASNSMGIVLESSVLVAPEVTDGTLIAPISHLSRAGFGYWIYTSAHGSRSSVEAVRAWLKKEATGGTVPQAGAA